MQCWIELDASALRNNYRILKSRSGKAVMAPVIKSNAYGHGLTEVYGILAGENPPWLAVNYPEEAGQLRRLGYNGRLMIVGPCAPELLAECHRLDATIFLTHQELKEAWIAAPKKPTAHIKFDTGMSRQGFLPEEAAALARELLPWKEQITGVCSHFANVEDVLEHDYATQQMKAFNQALPCFRDAGYTIMANIASSASTLLMEDSHYDLTRVGISLYGFWPSKSTRLSYLRDHNQPADLRPVLSWRTPVSSVKKVPKGKFIGYGCTYRTVHDTLVAVLPVGYAEGYPRAAGEQNSYVLISGGRCPVLGRICMNMMMVDVSHLPVPPKPGDTATLIGRDGEEVLDAMTLAGWAGTIHYELVTCLNPAIPRRVLDGNSP